MQPKLIYSLPTYKKNLISLPWQNEIAEACPDMNIKVAAFTLSEKSFSTGMRTVSHSQSGKYTSQFMIILYLKLSFNFIQT